MLLLGDISGIQDFLFDVHEVGGNQAASLRFRSIRIQLMVECIARRILWTLGLAEQDHLLYCAAGKFAIDATESSSNQAKLDAIRAETDAWLLRHTHGRIRCSIVACDASGTAAHRIEAANLQLQNRKLRPWASISWEAQPLVVPALFDLKAENERDADLGQRLVKENVTTLQLSDQSQASADLMMGVSIRFTSGAPVRPAVGQSSFYLNRVVRHVPQEAGGQLVEFIPLAARSRGASMLGVLKADADSVGAAIRNRLIDSTTFEPLKQFSGKLENFFGAILNEEMSRPGSRWNDIYTVFAGGDDLLLVGPWDILIDFAAHIRAQFMNEFRVDKLTISAGCAIIKPKFPIRLAAQQAEDLLEQAKSGTKDQFAALGDVWKWDDHPAIITAGRQLADWVGGAAIQRGWLHTLLELSLLRRGQGVARDAKLVPEMATSRLSYHVARNWPRANDAGARGAARQWIDQRLRQFDDFKTTTDPITLHLPAILRYAMLATRSQGDEV